MCGKLNFRRLKLALRKALEPDQSHFQSSIKDHKPGYAQDRDAPRRVTVTLKRGEAAIRVRAYD